MKVMVTAEELAELVKRSGRGRPVSTGWGMAEPWIEVTGPEDWQARALASIRRRAVYDTLLAEAEAYFALLDEQDGCPRHMQAIALDLHGRTTLMKEWKLPRE